MRRCHSMPFGAELLANGVRFRLWAPKASSVQLVREGAPPRPMAGRADGWYEILDTGAKVGDRYRFRIDDSLDVPDPASRNQPQDVHGPSEVIDPAAFRWPDDAWKGRPWNEVVLYELHVGCFTREGSFSGVERHLDYLAGLGVTAIELMPVAEYAGNRGWGYDGVLPFAPEGAYGTPDELKRLVAAAHNRNLMVFLDVVYNHFGPEGNYLHTYAPQFFTDRHHTPWGSANNFDDDGSRVVRDFFIHNALYWLEEYHIDGLRLDAVHAIIDDSHDHFLAELARRVRAAAPDRHVHLVLENDANQSRYLGPHLYDAQWNDDFHHVLHLLLTGETAGYYRDYREGTVEWLGRALTEGFAYQGEMSEHRGGILRGEPSKHLSAPHFVSFLQNHDQVGNRAFGDRLATLAPPEAIDAALAVLLLAPSIPLLFMGEEWGAERPFLYFCDFHDDLANAVREGRRREFEGFPQFADPASREAIPDPNALTTFEASILDWAEQERPRHAERLSLVRRLLLLRHTQIVPRLDRLSPGSGFTITAPHLLTAWWPLGGRSRLQLQANLGQAPTHVAGLPPGRIVFSNHGGYAALGGGGENLAPWTVSWVLS